MAINANNIFNLEEEARTQGTLGGKPLSKEERKEAFKKQGKVEFKTFAQKVLNKKEPTATKVLGGGATKALPPVKGKENEQSDVAKRIAYDFDSRLEDLLKNIREDVGGILTVVEKQVDIEEDAATEEKQETEKSKRKEKEDKSESKEKKPKTSGFVETLTKPVKGLWESIVGGFMKLLAGWGITQFLKWFGNPKNAENVKAFKEFVVSAVPVVIKGILALIALDIGLKVLAFVKLIALGSVKLLAGLKGLFLSTIGAIKANPYMALAFAGVAAIAAGAAYAGNKIQENRQAANEEDDESTLTVDEFSQQKDKSKVDIKPGQAYSETGSFPGMMNFNEGGFVSGPGGVDNVPARLTAGEYVMKKDAVNVWGVNTFETMNNSLKPTVYDHNIGQLNKSMDKKVVYVPMVRTNKHTTIVNRRG